MLPTLHRTNVVLDENIVQQALKLSKLKSKRAIIDKALHEYIENHKNNGLDWLIKSLDGESPFFEGYDYKAMRSRSLPKYK